VVTLLTPLPLEPDPELEPEVELELESEPLEPEPLVVVVVLGVDATVVADDAVEVLRASAGSCPETSTIAIINQVATNSATAPEITRRRILRVRAARSLRSAWPRARAASLLSVIRRVMGPASSRAVSPT
jgi:hypothetical protein